MLSLKKCKAKSSMSSLIFYEAYTRPRGNLGSLKAHLHAQRWHNKCFMMLRPKCICQNVASDRDALIPVRFKTIFAIEKGRQSSDGKKNCRSSSALPLNSHMSSTESEFENYCSYQLQGTAALDIQALLQVVQTVLALFGLLERSSRPNVAEKSDQL